MNNVDLQQKADELWYFFENRIFENSGQYSYNTNLVFAFSDYIETLSDDDLSEFLQSSDFELIQQFRLMLKSGVNHWLNDFAKTIAIM